jgi:vitamin B12 transport system substrate-binding protein
MKNGVLLIAILFSLCLHTNTSSANSSTSSASDKRLVVLAPNLVEIIFELGLGDNIVGTSEHTDFPEVAKSIPITANYLGVQIETLLALNPTLVIVWEGGTPPKDINKIKELGITVHSFSANGASEFIASIKSLGVVLNKEEAANTLATTLQKTLNQIKVTNAAKPSLTAFIELWPNPLTSASQGTIMSNALEYCGVKNIVNLDIDYPQINLEWLLIQKFDLIIQPLSKSSPTQLMEWQPYKMLSAVKNNAILQPDADVFLRWTPRWVKGLSQLCEQIDKFRKPIR